jgi:hypothetical protein
VHPFGGAPALSGGPYFPGQDIARGLALRSDQASGYLLDVTGKLYGIGGAPDLGPTPPSNRRAVGLVLIADDAAYVLRVDGAVQPIGAAPPVKESVTWTWWEPAQAIAVTGPGAGLVVDTYGGLHPFAPR